MGLLDRIKCENPVPDTEYQNGTFHAHGLGDTMSNYTIALDGRLVHHAVRYEREQREENHGRDAQVPAVPFLRSADSLRPVEQWDEEVPFHGDLFLLGDGVEYVARLAEGRVLWIKRTADAPEAEANRPWR